MAAGRSPSPPSSPLMPRRSSCRISDGLQPFDRKLFQGLGLALTGVALMAACEYRSCRPGPLRRDRHALGGDLLARPCATASPARTARRWAGCRGSSGWSRTRPWPTIHSSPTAHGSPRRRRTGPRPPGRRRTGVHRHHRGHHSGRGRAGHPPCLRNGEGLGRRPSAAIGQGARLAAPWAALVNGTAAHALDFDDNFDPAKAHATAVLAPAILALAEQEGASGRDCLDAYIAGLQILGRVGQGVNPIHRNRGWHATATVGAIGAAAACARLLKLDARAGGLCGVDRDQHGGRLHVAVRHDDQAAPCRPRRQVRRDGGQPRPERPRRGSRHARRPHGHEPADGRPGLRAAPRHAHPCRARPESPLRDRERRRAAAAPVQRPEAEALPQLRQRASRDGRPVGPDRRAWLCRGRGRGDPCPRAGHPSQQSDVPGPAGRAAGQIQPRIWARLRPAHRQCDARRLHRRGRAPARVRALYPPHPPPSGRQGGGRVPDRGRGGAEGRPAASRPRCHGPRAASPRRSPTRSSGPSSTAAPPACSRRPSSPRFARRLQICHNCRESAR